MLSRVVRLGIVNSLSSILTEAPRRRLLVAAIACGVVDLIVLAAVPISGAQLTIAAALFIAVIWLGMFGAIARPGTLGIGLAAFATVWVVGATCWMVASLVHIGHWL
jgi:hypothetical protein